MNENAQPAEGNGHPEPADTKRQYWIEADGNVHGVALTMQVDHFFEFTDQAIDLTPGSNGPDKPSA